MRITRRGFVTGSLVVLAAPRAVGSQSSRIARVGILGITPMDKSLVESFREGLGRFGYTEGRNIVVEYRDAAGRPDRLSDLAADLVRLNIDVMFARGPGALAAAQRATSRIAIVAVDLETDPVAVGFVRTLAQPGGNITGVFLDLPEVSAKQLQLVKEGIPAITRVAILGDPRLNASQFRATEAAARALALEPQLLDVRAPKEFDSALEGVAGGRATAVLLLSSPLVFTGRTEIAALTLKRRLPAVSMFVEFAQAGGLMTYGPNLREAFQRAGAYVGRILQGARPADLPVERPAKFDLVVNLKTAKALGLTLPSSLLARADQVIQ